MTEPTPADPERRSVTVETLAAALHESGIRCSPNIPYCRATHRGHAARLLAAIPQDATPAGLRAAAVRLREATDYPDGVKAFGILCDAIEAAVRGLPYVRAGGISVNRDEVIAVIQEQREGGAPKPGPDDDRFYDTILASADAEPYDPNKDGIPW